MKAIKLIAQDRPGLLADLTALLARWGINIDAISAKSMDRQAVIELVADRPQEAMRALVEHGFQVVADHLLTIRIADRPGALAQISRELSDAKLSIRSITMLHRQDGFGILAMSTDNDAVAREVLHGRLV